MAEKKQEIDIEVVGEKPIKKAASKKPAAETIEAPATEKKAPAKKAAPKAEPAKAEAKAEPVKEAAATVVAAPAEEKPAAAKKPAKKAAKAKAPLYINGRYVVEKQLPAKPVKGAKPYAEAKKQIKVTLVKSTNGCLKDQIATVKALGLTKIRSSNVLPDNAAIRGMVFKVKHLVVVEEVK